MSREDTSLRVAIRADASIEIGTGHVMRCLTLAAALRARGAQCVFICRELDGHLMDLVRAEGHAVLALPRPAARHSPAVGDPPHAHWLGTGWEDDAQDTLQALEGHGQREGSDWLIVDHYGLEARWESALRPACSRLMVIDDLADRPHECDLLVDPSLGRAAEDYADLLPEGARVLPGTDFTLLRPEFAANRDTSLVRRAEPRLRHLLISLGGVDRDNATGRVLAALAASALPPELTITVVMGPHAPWLAEVRAQAEAMPCPTELRAGVRDMAGLMARSDLAIGAAGGTAWERCCLGLPTLLLVLAENQIGIACNLERAGAAVPVGREELETRLSALFADPAQLDALMATGPAAAALVDGRGVARVADQLAGCM